MIANDNLEKIYFNPGEKVKVKHNLPNTPTMYVVDKVNSSLMKSSDKVNMFIGIRCRWFDTNEQLQEAIFSTKDLIHI